MMFGLRRKRRMDRWSMIRERTGEAARRGTETGQRLASQLPRADELSSRAEPALKEIKRASRRAGEAAETAAYRAAALGAATVGAAKALRSPAGKAAVKAPAKAVGGAAGAAVGGVQIAARTVGGVVKVMFALVFGFVRFVLKTAILAGVAYGGYRFIQWRQRSQRGAMAHGAATGSAVEPQYGAGTQRAA